MDFRVYVALLRGEVAKVCYTCFCNFYAAVMLSYSYAHNLLQVRESAHAVQNLLIAMCGHLHRPLFPFSLAVLRASITVWSESRLLNSVLQQCKMTAVHPRQTVLRLQTPGTSGRSPPR